VDFSKPVNKRRSRAGAAYSALVGWTADRALPRPLRSLAYRAFARATGANLDEVELPLGAYASLGDFFARGLRDGAREIDPDPQVIISPCDGVIAALGVAGAGTLVQAKGRSYQLAELVADATLAQRLAEGAYATIYLSPRDYHRVHAPVDGRVVSYEFLPGYLWPVNPRLATRRDGLLARNERVVIRLHSPTAGTVAVVMVGAAGVGNIRLTHGLSSRTLRAAHQRYRVELDDVVVRRGDELGAFRLGSTVVMVFEHRRAGLTGQVGDVVQLGQRIGGLGEQVQLAQGELG
jgi:phosphatidylserine decarboxylase